MFGKINKMLCVMLVALLLVAIFAACDPKTPQTPDADFTVEIRSVGGAPLGGVKVALSSNGTEVASAVTDDKGVASFYSLSEGNYDYEISDLPNGYYFADPADATGHTDAKKSIALAFPSQVTSAPRTDRLYKEGDIFFDFEICDVMSGKPYKLSELLAEKKAVLINFWNTSCGPCVSEMPGLNSAFKQYSDKVQVLAVSSMLFDWDTVEGVRSFANGFADENALTFPLFADGVNEVHFARYLSLTSLPTNVVIDRYGMVAYIKRGAEGSDVFMKLFEKYSADDYAQAPVTGGDVTGGGEEDPELERIEPTVKPQDSAVIGAAINADGFDGRWYPETETEDAKYSWPWIVDEISDGGQSVKVLKPSNHYVDYSFATIKTKVTVSQSDIDENGKVALAFDLKYSTELWGDYFYVLVNNEEVYSFTGTEHWSSWQTCYAFVAEEPGEYELALLYNKDDLNGGGEDVVYVKNVRMLSKSQINAEAQTLDMPRDAVANWNATSKRFGKYAPAVLGEDGYYHYDNQSGPYILANLYGMTPFHTARGYERNISEATVQGVFKDAEGNDMAATVTEYLMAANNSQLAGLTVVTPALKDMLNKFAGALYPECGEDAWLEFCIWFEHFGYDATDKGISTPERNPVRGLMKSAAIPMAPAHQGMFADLSNIENQYKNHVVIDRIIMPRGVIYSFVPDKSGAYRFRSQSSRGSDATAWLRDADMGINAVLTEFGEEREDPDADYNFIITWYLEQDRTYYLSVSLADVGGTGEFDFTTEYLGEYFYSWQAVSRSDVTFEDGEGGELGALKNYNNAYPVLASDGYYYDALRNEDGTPKTNAQGELMPDMNDPIYVDFLHGSRFMEQTLKSVIEMGDATNISERLCTKILPSVFADYSGAITITTTLAKLNGSTLTDDVWQRLAAAITASYGEVVGFEGEAYDALCACTTVRHIVNLLKDNFLNAFDFSGYVDMVIAHYDVDGNVIVDEQGNPILTPMYEYLGVEESELKNYTSEMKRYLNEAESKTVAEHGGAEYGGGFDEGSLKLSEGLCVCLKLFAQRYGWTGLHTDWTRLCYHYEYIGPYAS